MQYIPIQFVLSGIIFLSVFTGTAWGHGTDIDTSKVIEIGDKKIQITTEIVNITELEQNIIITVLDKNSDKSVGDITLLVELYHDGENLLQEYFIAHDGILKISVIPSMDPIQIDGVWEESLGAWGNGDIVLRGLDLVGLYTFEMYIDKASLSDQFLGNTEMFRTDVSVIEEITHVQNDLTNSTTEFVTRSYFESVTDFKYNAKDDQVSFQIPFDWDDEIISHVPVVHIEVRFPKDFSKFFSNGYDGAANGIDLFDSAVTIDDYTVEDYRIVHFVLLEDQLRYLKNIMRESDKISESIIFTLNVNDEIKFPLTAMTRDEQFQIDLSWVPLEISPEEKTEFVFTIRDGITGEPLRHSSYDFIILQADNVIYKTSGTAIVGGDYEEYVFKENEAGSTTIRFENIRGTGQQTEFSVVVVPELSIPLLVLASAVSLSVILNRFRTTRL